MIDRETWVLLAERLIEIREAREVQPEVKLEFDANDQARVVPVTPAS